MTGVHHIPVLLNESISYLIHKPGGTYFDGTVGFGGHSDEFLKKLNTTSVLIGVDRDEDAYNHCKSKFSNDSRVKLFKTDFSKIDTIAKIEFLDKFDGIFADLGVSSFQLDNPQSGFTYREDVPLDLRMDKSRKPDAAFVINKYEQDEIADIIYNYGEEGRSRVIARKIVEERSKGYIKTTFQLRDIIKGIVPSHQLMKTLSKVFQALRIYVNDELGELERFLERGVNLLNKDGRIVILTYHSLEDRIVKEFFKKEAEKYEDDPNNPFKQIEREPKLEVITRKPVTPSAGEIKNNTRARSAKLRAAKRL